MNETARQTLLAVLDNAGVLVLMATILWAIGTKRLVPGWVYEECRARCGKETP